MHLVTIMVCLCRWWVGFPLSLQGKSTSLSLSRCLPGNRFLPPRGRGCVRTRAPAESYVSALAPLHARWLKRREERARENMWAALRTLVRHNFFYFSDVVVVVSCAGKQPAELSSAPEEERQALCSPGYIFIVFLCCYLCFFGGYHIIIRRNCELIWFLNTSCLI